MIKIKVLFINNTQFGYMLDMNNYFEYFSDEYFLKLICLNQNKEMKQNKYNNLKVDYVSHSNKYLKQIKFLFIILYEIYFGNHDRIFLTNFKFCFLIGILSFFKKKINLDIRTQSVNSNKFLRRMEDYDIKLASLFFKNITIISEGCAKNLNIKKYKVLPLGGKKITSKNNNNNFDILYIGTFQGRRLEDTIIGVVKFRKKYPNLKFKYRIIGEGKEKLKLQELIEESRAEDYIELLGFIPYDKIKKYFEVSRIGVSYVPITQHYNFQPPTKTFEYIVNGLFCLGTSTHSNREIINEKNGILCMDNPDSFYETLEEIYIKNLKNELTSFEKENYEWSKIVKHILIEKILNT